jgi:hypothetical protein
MSDAPSHEYEVGLRVAGYDWRVVQIEFSAALGISNPSNRWNVTIESPDGVRIIGSGVSQPDATEAAFDRRPDIDTTKDTQ